jgi:DNA mismatch endonuclease (patch repair protein)
MLSFSTVPFFDHGKFALLFFAMRAWITYSVEMSWALNEGIRRSMQGNRSRDTVPEMTVRKLLHAAGFRYRVAARPIPTLRRTADILFTRAKIAVFIDGCFWHGCPDHYVEPKSHVDYWRPKIERNMSRDLETTAQLEDAGWIVLRYWSHELSPTIAESVADRVRATRVGAYATPTQTPSRARVMAT